MEGKKIGGFFLGAQRGTLTGRARYAIYLLLFVLSIPYDLVPQSLGLIFLAEILIIVLKTDRKKLGVAMIRAAYFLVIFLVISIAFGMAAASLHRGSIISASDYPFASSIALSLSFPATAVLYLRLADPGKKSVASRVGMGIRGLSFSNILLGIFLFLIVLVMEIIVGLISSITNVQINTNAGELLVGAPIWFYVFVSIFSPINEEVLFRGLFVSRMGIVASAALFAVLHYSYGSTFSVEVIAALIFGLIAGYVYKKTQSLYPSAVAHLIVNTFTVLSSLSFLIWAH